MQILGQVSCYLVCTSLTRTLRTSAPMAEDTSHNTNSCLTKMQLPAVCGAFLPLQIVLQVWEDQDVLYYSSGRFEFDTYDTTGENQAFMILSNTTTFLCQRGLLHWGKRVIVSNYEAHDVTRGLEIFGDAVLSGGLINRQSGNRWGQFPGAKAIIYSCELVRSMHHLNWKQNVRQHGGCIVFLSFVDAEES
jgi:hypothetical protein